jgi:hypothetical protein
MNTFSGLLIGLTLLAGPEGLTPVCVIMLVSVFLPTFHAILTGHELRTGFFRRLLGRSNCTLFHYIFIVP